MTLPTLDMQMCWKTFVFLNNLLRTVCMHVHMYVSAYVHCACL